MARVLTNENNYYNIADTIRQMKEVNTTYKPREMASALKDIYSNEVEGTLPLTFESNGMPLIDYRIDGASGGVGDKTNNLCESFTSTMSTIQYANALLIKTNFQESTTYVISFKLTEGCKVYANETIFTQSIRVVGQGQNSTINVTLTTLSDLSNAQMLNNFYRVFKNAITQENSPVFYDVQIIQGNNEPLNYEPNGYKVPVVISGKNLFDENAITNEILRDNDGTTNSNNNWRCSNFINIPQNNNNILISWESDSAYFQAKIAFYDNQKNFISLSNYGINNTYLITFNLPNNCEFIRFSYSQTVNNVPANRHNIQIILGSTPTDYEPYHEPTTTNIYLDEPIEENESISLSDTEVDIPTIEGTNTLTIDTTVQPSNVYVQARKDPDEIVYLTTILEEEI